MPRKETNNDPKETNNDLIPNQCHFVVSDAHKYSNEELIGFEAEGRQAEPLEFGERKRLARQRRYPIPRFLGPAPVSPWWDIGDEIPIGKRRDIAQVEQGIPLKNWLVESRTREALAAIEVENGYRAAPPWQQMLSHRCWEATCKVCGRYYILSKFQLQRGKRCACHGRRKVSRSRPGAARYHGQQFGRLYVVAWVDDGAAAGRGWECECWCGGCGDQRELVHRSRDLERKGKRPCPHVKNATRSGSGRKTAP